MTNLHNNNKYLCSRAGRLGHKGTIPFDVMLSLMYDFMNYNWVHFVSNSFSFSGCTTTPVITPLDLTGKSSQRTDKKTKKFSQRFLFLIKCFISLAMYKCAWDCFMDGGGDKYNKWHHHMSMSLCSRQPCPTIFFLPIWHIYGCYGNIAWLILFLLLGPKAAVYKVILCTLPILVCSISLKIC